jgi:steroid delta-isomerase-like uncharacterized protein
MSTESHKASAQRFMDEVINAGNMPAADEILNVGFFDHTAYPGMPPSREGRKMTVSMMRAAFPNLQITAEDMIAEGDRLVIRHTIHGTHQHEFMGIPATGREIEVGGVTIVRFEDGQIVEHWLYNDGLGMLRQLGAIPAPEQAVA